MQISTAIELFILDCQLRRLKSRSVEHYQRSLAIFANNIDVADIDEITEKTLQQFQIRYADKSAQYVKNLLVVVSMFLKYHEKEIRIRYPKIERKVKKSFTKKEVEIILNSCSRPVHRLFIMFALDTGARLNEIRNIETQDVDLKQGLVHIKHGKTGERIVPIGVRLRKELIAYLNGRTDKPLFLSQHGTKFSKNGLTTMFRKLRVKTGIPHCSSHTCRRTFATSMYRAGMNIHVLAKLMGHTDLQTLKQYLDITTEDLQAQHALFSPLDNI